MKIFISLLLCIPLFCSCIEDNTPTLTCAALITQDIVNDEFAADCDYDNLDIRGQETSKNTFVVYQSFTSEMTGYKRNYVYKAKAEYTGGDKYDNSSWNISDVIVEDKGSGRQWHLN